MVESIHPPSRSDNLELLLREQRELAIRGLKRWGGFFLAVSALFLVVSGVGDLRLVNPIYVPTTVLLVAGCLVLGYTLGKFRTVRRVVAVTRRPHDL